MLCSMLSSMALNSTFCTLPSLYRNSSRLSGRREERNEAGRIPARSVTLNYQRNGGEDGTQWYGFTGR